MIGVGMMSTRHVVVGFVSGIMFGLCCLGSSSSFVAALFFLLPSVAFSEQCWSYVGCQVLACVALGEVHPLLLFCSFFFLPRLLVVSSRGFPPASRFNSRRVSFVQMPFG